MSAGEALAFGVMASLALRLSHDEVLSRSDLADGGSRSRASPSLSLCGSWRSSQPPPSGRNPVSPRCESSLDRPDPRRPRGLRMDRASALPSRVAAGARDRNKSLAQAALEPLHAGFARDGLAISSPTWSGVVVEEGCSAFRNVSLATLIWISLVKLDSLTMRPAYFVIAAAMIAATVALNTVRIAMMALSPEMYDTGTTAPASPSWPSSCSPLSSMSSAGCDGRRSAEIGPFHPNPRGAHGRPFGDARRRIARRPRLAPSRIAGSEAAAPRRRRSSSVRISARRRSKPCRQTTIRRSGCGPQTAGNRSMRRRSC